MTVCRFYQQGNCRFGNACKFEHPPKGGQQNYGQQNYGQQSYGQQSGNRFGVLAGQGNQGNQGRGPAADTPPYPGLTADVIRRELTDELPQWILSCYGPGRDAPEQLFGGYPREQSFEEIRLHFMQGAMAGNPQGALNDIKSIYDNAQQQIQHTLSNVPAAVEFIVAAANKHPNRIDICKEATGGGGMGPTANAFQKPAAPTLDPFGARAPAAAGTGFGQPGALGQRPNPFGAPAFGQPAQPAASPFGQPAQPAAPGFGQASTLGGTSAFGRPAQTTSAFGQPATLGATPSAFGAPAFGQPAQPANAPGGFGQPAFGQTATLGATPRPFGAPPTGPSGFAAPAAGANAAQPAANPFGNPPQAAQATNPFGNPPQQAQPTNPFGNPPQQAQTANPFGKPPQPAGQTGAVNNPFGQPAPAPANAFAQPQQPANPFGAPAPNAAPTNPFGQNNQQPTNNAFAAAPANPFGQPIHAAKSVSVASAGAGGPYGPNATRQHPDISSYSSRAADGTLSMFKGRPVVYEVPKGGTQQAPMIRNFDGSMTRIWMPEGAPAYTADTEAEPEKYQDPKVQQQWKGFLETGRFADGVIPEVPPKREFCTWDF